MRAGAIPLLVWSLLIAALFAIHWVWTGDTLQTASLGFALGLVLAVAGVSVALDRDAVRRGPPEPEDRLEAVPAASLGALLVAAGVVGCGFGLVFGTFLVCIAAGIFLVGTALVIRELADERRARARWRRRADR